MNWNDFFTKLSAGSVENAYLFTGPEDFVKREALEKLRAALLPPGLEALNENILEGTDAAHIVDAAETLPMMCDRRLVVVRDWGPLMGGKSRDEENETRRVWNTWIPPTAAAVWCFTCDRRRTREKSWPQR